MTQVRPYLTAEQVAERFQISAETVRAWARTDKIPCIKLPGGRMRFRHEDIEAIERGDEPVSVAS